MMNTFRKWWLLLAIAVLPLSAHAQSGLRSVNFTTASASSAINNINTGLAYHAMVWHVQGTASVCTVALDTSVDAVTWTAGGAITGQTCTSTGGSAVVNVIANYVRINMTALTVTAGSSVNVTWEAWTCNPASCGGGGGGGGIGGAIANTQVAVGNGVNTIAGSNEFTFNSATGLASLPGVGAHTALLVGPDVFTKLDTAPVIAGQSLTNPTSGNTVTSLVETSANYTADTTMPEVHGVSVLFGVSDSHAHPTSFVGSEFDLNISGSGSYSLEQFGSSGFASIGGTATTTGKVYGLFYGAGSAGTTPSLTFAAGVAGQLQAEATGGTITTGYGLYAPSPVIGGLFGTTVTHYHALHIEDPTIGGGTLNPDPYAIYVDAGRNRLNAGVGQTLPVLDVNSTSTASTIGAVSIRGGGLGSSGIGAKPLLAINMETDATGTVATDISNKVAGSTFDYVTFLGNTGDFTQELFWPSGTDAIVFTHDGTILFDSGNGSIALTLDASQNVKFSAGLEPNNGHLLISSTAPTVSSGFGTGASITANNGPAAFRLSVGTSNTGTGVVGLPTATTGWNCYATNITTKNTNQATVLQTASTTASATFQNYTDVMGTHAMTDNDVLAISCFAY
jgi:hypothetical protein